MILRMAVCFCLMASAWAQKPPAPAAAPPAYFQISGTLVDSLNDQPISRARVAVAPVTERSAFTTVITGGDGRFVIKKLVAGKYSLTAQRRGYLTQSFNQHDEFSSSIAVGAGLNSQDLVFRIAPEAVISGAITDESGDPVRQAVVMIFKAGDSSGRDAIRVVNRAVADDEGSYRFGHLWPGKYLLAVMAKPWYAQGTTSSGGSGVVVSASGATMAGRNTSDDVSQGPVDAKTAALDVAYPVTFYPGATDPASAGQITLAFGEQAVANVNLQPVPALHFHVKPESQNQQSYATLEVRVFDTSVALPATSNREPGGMLTLSGVAPGHYTLKMNDYGSGATQTASVREIEVSGSGDLAKSQTVARPPVTVSLQFEPGAVASPQSAVRMYNKKTGESLAERINDKGEVEFKNGVPPGSYEISVTSAQGLYLKSITSPSVKPIGRTVELRGTGPVKLSVLVALGQARITGVALQDDKPLAGVMILLVPADAAHNFVLFRRDQSDTDGTFTLADVVPGQYTLLALENGWDLAWSKPAVLKPFLPQGEVLNVQPNGKYDVKLKVQ